MPFSVASYSNLLDAVQNTGSSTFLSKPPLSSLFDTIASPPAYSVTPIVGVAIAIGGQQLVSTVQITYAIESSKAPGHAALLVAMTRQVYVSPFPLVRETLPDEFFAFRPSLDRSVSLQFFPSFEQLI